MKIDLLSSSTVKITLSGGDMLQYDVKYEALSHKNADTKRLLTELFSVVQLEKNVAFDVRNERLFIEAFPRSDGGCMLYISALETVPQKDTQLLCDLTGAFPLCHLCTALLLQKERTGITFDSKLYGKGNSYLLLLQKIPENKIIGILNEFGIKKAYRELSLYIKNGYKELINSEAVELIAN